jgi:Protein of unknown function (DUF2442)/Domain of unknown function (DUF4160)
MHVRDYPPPHFQAIYGEHEAFVAIETGAVIEGSSPNGAARLVSEWALAGQLQLRKNWPRAPVGEQPGGSEVSMLTKVTRLEKLDGFRLRVRFNDGSEGVHDFAAMVKEPGPMLEPLRDEDHFARVFLEFGAPTWPNGFDIAPESLRREMAAAGELGRVAAE